MKSLSTPESRKTPLRSQREIGRGKTRPDLFPSRVLFIDEEEAAALIEYFGTYREKQGRTKGLRLQLVRSPEAE